MVATRGTGDVPSDELEWKRTWVEGRPALYGVAGEGRPVVLLHGWGVGLRSYRHVIGHLVADGCRVHAPALPGFGGSHDLRPRWFSLDGYGRWVDDFLHAVRVDGPVAVIGHSFGGGVATTFTHQHADRVDTLVLVNAVGGATWKADRLLADRPIWHWGISFPADMWPLTAASRVLPAVLEEALPNLVRNPLAIWRVAQLARSADLTAELADLAARGTRVAALWSRSDAVIPEAAFDAMCRALGIPGLVVDGGHTWLLADPARFARVVAPFLRPRVMAPEAAVLRS
jgi:pimeloyl-ACP methyl ester carboxylesterase